MNELLELQENLFDYFKDLDDKTFVAFVDSFVYRQGTNDSNISKLSTKFLEDSDLGEAFCSYEMDLKDPPKFFMRSSGAKLEIINNIKIALLSVSHNRFRNYV